MSRVATKLLDEVIEHEGETRRGPVSPFGVLRLALDLKEARARVAELEHDVAEFARNME